MRRALIAFVAGLALGGLTLLALGVGDTPARADTPEPRAPTAAGVERTRVVSAPYGGPSLAEIRQTVRDEMASTAAGPPGEPVEEASSWDPEREADANAAYADATQLLDTALGQGVWDDEDAAAIRALIVRMDAAQTDEVMGGLVTAINDQRLDVTTTGMPF